MFKVRYQLRGSEEVLYKIFRNEDEAYKFIKELDGKFLGMEEVA